MQTERTDTEPETDIEDVADTEVEDSGEPLNPESDTDAESQPAEDEAIIDDPNSSGHDETEGTEPDEPDEPDEPSSDAEPTEKPIGNEGADEASEGGESSKEEEEEARIPYKRFQEVVRQKNAYKRDAETLSAIRETAKKAGWSEQATQEWLELGFGFKNNPTAKPYRDVIASMAKMAGLQVVEALPDDIAKAVESGQITEDYAKELAKSRYNDAEPENEYKVPSLADTGYSAEQAQEDVNEVVNSYKERHKDLFAKPEIVEETNKAVLAEFDRLEKLTGVYPIPEKWGEITRRVVTGVVARHRQPVVKPTEQPLRSSGVPRPSRKNKSLGDIADSDYMRKAFG